MDIKDLESLDVNALEALDTKALEDLDLKSVVAYGYDLREKTESRIRENPKNNRFNARRAEINNVLSSFSGLDAFSEANEDEKRGLIDVVRRMIKLKHDPDSAGNSYEMLDPSDR